jgi:hypothetical protein
VAVEVPLLDVVFLFEQHKDSLDSPIVYVPIGLAEVEVGAVFEVDVEVLASIASVPVELDECGFHNSILFAACGFDKLFVRAFSVGGNDLLNLSENIRGELLFALAFVNRPIVCVAHF